MRLHFFAAGAALTWALAACSGGMTGDDANSGDASADGAGPLSATEQRLVGTWQYTNGSPGSLTVVYTEEFRADRTATVTEVYSNAQCSPWSTTTIQQTWSATDTTLTLLPTAAGCSAMDSVCMGQAPPNQCGGLLAATQFPYMVDGSTLTISMPANPEQSSSLQGTYTRQ